VTRYDFFVVLEDDLLRLPEDRIRDLAIRMTIVGGRPVYEATPTPAR
jgi:predicted amidohydrolase YtcJ